MTNFPVPGGLRHVLLLDGTGGVTEFNWAKVDAWVPEQGCLWLHFDFEDAGVAEWLRQESGLNELASEYLRHK